MKFGLNVKKAIGITLALVTTFSVAAMAACADAPHTHTFIDKGPCECGAPYADLVVADVNAWTNSRYGAFDMTVVFDGAAKEEEIEYIYDTKKLTIDAVNKTVKPKQGVKGAVPVTVKTASYEKTFNVNCFSMTWDEQQNSSVWDTDNNPDPGRGKGYYSWALGRLNGFAEKYNPTIHDNTSTIFIGDSFFDQKDFWWNFNVSTEYDNRHTVTAGYTVPATFENKNAFCWGIGASTTYNWEMFLDEGEFLANEKPKNIVINLGTNNIYPDSNDEVLVTQNLQRLFTYMHNTSPNTKFYYYSIAFRNNGYRDDIVEASNDIMEEWCRYKDWITFVDIEDDLTLDKLLIDNGFKKDGSISYDGLHPTKSAYNDVFKPALLAAGCVIEDLPTA